MAQRKITKTTVDRLKPSVKGDGIKTDGYIWDTDLKGFGCKCTPAGNKSFLIQYRIGGRNGRTRRMHLGRHGEVTTDQARKRAKALLGEAAAGVDPKAKREAAERQITIDQLWSRFSEEHLIKRKPRTLKEYGRLFEKNISPTIGKTCVTDVKRGDISRLHHSMKDTPYQANRVLAVLKKLFNWAETHEYRPEHSNPATRIEKYPEYGRERFLSEAEFARLASALRDVEIEAPYFVACVRLLIFTGCRLEEILTARWANVDFERGLLLLPDSKRGKRPVVLSPPALEILSELPRIIDNEYVIVGSKPGSHLVNTKDRWAKVREAAGIPDVRIHDLRHSFASVAATSGNSIPMIGKLLGHTQAQTTARYAHLADDPVRQASNAIGAKIDAAMKGKSARIVRVEKAQ